MLASARRRFDGRVPLVEASATAIPFPDASFDHLTFTYLLRYVDDPGATLAELARVVRPGGTVASLEFCVPRGVWRPLWDLYVGVGLPLAGRVDLARLARGRPLPRPLDPRLLRGVAARAPAGAVAARRASATSVARRLSLGGGVVISRDRRSVRPAFYALRQGGWRDYVTLLHAPYTAWHLAYVVVGGCLVAEVPWGRLGLTVLAFFLAMGIGAHALDELAGRPLQTAIPSASSSRSRSPRWPRRARSASRSRSTSRSGSLPLVAVGAFLVPGVQPRAVRRPLPLRPLVRPRVGRLSRRDRVRRVLGDAPARGAARRGVGDRRSRSPSAGSRLRCGGPSRGRRGLGRARAAGRRP